MVIGKVLARRALITLDREVLIFKGKTITFRELNQRADRMANALLALGVGPGDRVDELPGTPSGKVLKKDLRSLAADYDTAVQA